MYNLPSQLEILSTGQTYYEVMYMTSEEHLAFVLRTPPTCLLYVRCTPESCHQLMSAHVNTVTLALGCV